MTFFPNSKGIQFFLSEMIFRIHPTLTSGHTVPLTPCDHFYFTVISPCYQLAKITFSLNVLILFGILCKIKINSDYKHSYLWQDGSLRKKAEGKLSQA